MKTKTLIKLLQEADPSGEDECCVGNHDILSVHNAPAYWDGDLQVLIRDESKAGYNVIGAKFVRGGRKINIMEHSIEDAISCNLEFGKDIPVDTSTEYQAARVKRWKEKAAALEAEILAEMGPRK